jgi:hypothetical protein
LKDTLLQLIDINEGKKKEVRLKAFCVCQRELEGTQYKLTTEMAQKSRDSMLLIGARVPEAIFLVCRDSNNANSNR